MELRHLRYFLAIADEMNFTRAAEKLMIAQPPLSRQIHDLEAEIGAPLFIREPHRLRLTEEGELFRQYAQQIITLCDRSVNEVRELHGNLHGTLYLGMVEGNAPHMISEWIARFHHENPRVQYDLWNGNSDEVALRVRRGLCELAVIMTPYNEEELDGILIYEEPWVAIMSNEHPLAQLPGKGVTLEQLGKYDLLLPSRHSRQLEIYGWFNKIGATPRVVCRTSNMINAIELAEQNIGVAIFPASNGIETEAARGGTWDKVRIREIDDPDIRVNYVLVHARDRELSHIAAQFMDYVLKQREQEPQP